MQLLDIRRVAKNSVKIFFFSIFFFFLLWSCSTSAPNLPLQIPFPHHALPNITIFWSADVTGNLEPCGCRGGRMGGLPRQSQFLLKSRKIPNLLLDAGNLMAPSPKYPEFFKWYYMLLVYDRIGYDAINLGQNELKLPSFQITSLIKKIPIKILSCNVLDASTQTYLVSPYIIKEIQGLKIGITGLVEPFESPGENIAFLEPQAALQRCLPQINSQCNMVIVLANLSPASVSQITENFPQIHLILNTGDTGTFAPQQIGSTAVSSLTYKGRYLQSIHFDFAKSGELAWVMGRDIRLGDDIEDHPGTVHILKQYREGLAEKRFYLFDLPAEEKKFAGVSQCKSCHSRQYEIWQNTKHAHSLDTLKRKKSQHDPKCLQCHITGFGAKQGFSGEDKTPDLAFVGCETCHGPSAEHTFANTPNQLAPLPSNPTPKQKCLECHTWEHCENFDFETFWAKIAHNGK